MKPGPGDSWMSTGPRDAHYKTWATPEWRPEHDRLSYAL